VGAIARVLPLLAPVASRNGRPARCGGHYFTMRNDEVSNRVILTRH
jgi:hypothetical protein